jgi:DNA-binding CsgD family transcriptional regulator
MKTNAFLLIIFLHFTCLFPLALEAQRYGVPGIHNYMRSEYKGGTQNWAVAQAPNGMVYFGNNEGLVEYDGAHWSVYNDMGQVVRSLLMDGKRIYVGSFNKFGFYEENQNGILKFNSLLPLLKNRMTDFDEIWRIHKTSFGIVFQSRKAIFIYNQDKIDIVSPKSTFHFSYYVNDILWMYDAVEGLVQYRDGKIMQIPGGSKLVGTEIWTILPLSKDQVIIGTAKKGVFMYDGKNLIPWEKPVNSLLKKYQLYSGAVIDKKYFAFGTIQNGVIVTDTAGLIITQINKEKGLLNNTVLSIGCDQENNIWLGLDNGISFINFSSPLTFIQNYVNIGSGYVSARLGSNLYLGTNQGLFCIRWSDFINPLKKKEDFQLIEGTEGQVWSLAVIDNMLICGHNSGVFQVHDNVAEKISTVVGGWTIRKAENNDKLLLVGNYSGISVFERKGQGWVYRNELAGFNQSSHFLEFDTKGYIWVGHGYKGIFRIKPDADLYVAQEVRFYNTKNGLPSDMGNYIFKLKSGIVAGTSRGIFRHNEATDRFETDNQFGKLIPFIGQIDYLMQDEANNIWYYNNQQPGVLRFLEDGSYKNISNPFKDLAGMLVAGYGNINPLDAKNVLIGVEGGFAHYYSAQYKNYSVVPTLYISNIHSGDTSEGTFRYYSSSRKQNFIPRFKFRSNSISFTYASNQYSKYGTKYQVFLKGFDETWSEWSAKNTKEYTNLPYGRHTFMVKAMKEDGTPSPVLSYSFNILPPWYFSIVAWIIYILALLLFINFMYRFFLRSIEKSREKEKERQRSKYKLREQQFKSEAFENEKEMIRLRNEKLSQEMIYKEKELANSTMLLIKKNNILSKLQTDLRGINSTVGNEVARNSINSLIKRIDKEIDSEKQWKVFNTHIEQVYDDLFKKLKENYPELTPRELSLCAYLRMNISSKEIATLMNISARGVEISRYRIRKKLHLDRDANLTEFMLNL